MRVTVDRSGRVSDAKIDKSSGHALLDDAALAAARRCSGTPAMKNGRAVESTATITHQWAND